MGKNYTLYINIDNFAREDNKSGLVNQLLARHYAGQVFEPEVRLVQSYAPDTSKGKLEVPLVDTFDSDLNTYDPYEGLILDTVMGRVYNTETGEAEDADPEMIKELKRRGQVR